MSTTSSSSGSQKSRAPGKAPMVEPEAPRRMETRSLTRKRRALGGESSSHPTAAVPVEPVLSTEAGDRTDNPLDDPGRLKEVVGYQGWLIRELK